MIRKFILTAYLLMPLILLMVAAKESPELPRAVSDSNPPDSRKIANLANEEIAESSGVAESTRTPGTFWTHNDSGDRARIFAFDRTGKHLGECSLEEAQAVDWEDIASLEHDGKHWLLLADVGDNLRMRRHCTLYLCEEPLPGITSVPSRAIHFRYEDGPQNCEAVGVDLSSTSILLLSKVSQGTARLYELPFPPKVTGETLEAKKICEVPIRQATAMDISADGCRAMVLTYGDAYCFERKTGENWGEAFKKEPQQVGMPARRQGEAICFGRDGRTLYLTTEGTPSPFWEVPFAAAGEARCFLEFAQPQNYVTP